MKVSFVTTCNGRLDHLARTLPSNIGTVAGTGLLEWEFVVVAYGDDRTWTYLKESYANTGLVRAGRLRILHVPGVAWNVSRAKNLAHLHATGELLVNVDADNFVSGQWAVDVHNFWDRDLDPHRLVGYPEWLEGNPAGRVVLTRDSFLRLQGYEEYGPTAGWGAEDDDLKQRAARAGLYYVRVGHEMTIQHSHSLRFPGEDVDDPARARAVIEERTARWRRFIEDGERVGRTRANYGKAWGTELAYDELGRQRGVSQRG